MKFPTNTALLTEAKAYALESIGHTVDYDGWKDGHEKLVRITTGKWAQLWLAEVCRLNGYPHKVDRSSPYVPDRLDLEINGWRIDSKVVTHDMWDGQVTSHHDKNKSSLDYYAFFRTDKLCTFIEPLGFVLTRDLEGVAERIEAGNEIPGTQLEQRFGHSYFLAQKQMKRFFPELLSMANRQRWDDQQVPDNEFGGLF